MSQTKISCFDLAVSNAKTRNEIKRAVCDVIDSDWFILGEQLAKFERLFASFCDVQYAIGVASGLDALKIALASVGVGVGDQVVVPTHTFIASALAVSSLGATPVLVDVNIQSGLLDKQSLDGVDLHRVKAIMPVHLYGHVCPMQEILELSKKFALMVVEDASQAHGARYCENAVGSFGDASGFSLYPTKNLGAFGDAGVITISDVERADWIKKYRNYGSSKKNVHQFQGVNSRLSEIQAAVLLIKLKYFDQDRIARRELGISYRKRLASVGDLQLLEVDPNCEPVEHLFIVRTKHRYALQAYLLKNGIETQVHYPAPVHLQEAYKYLGYSSGQFPNAELFCDTCVSLPFYPGMAEGDLEKVCEQVETFFEGV